MPQFANAQAAFGYVQDQAYNISAEVIRAEYPATDINQLMIVETAGNPWAAGVATYTLDGSGTPRWIAGNTNTIPRADIARGKVELPFEMGALGYGWTLEEVNQAAMMGVPLATELAFYARQGAEQFIYNVAVLGDTLRNLGGLINNAGISQGNVPADGTGSSRLWSAKSWDLVVRDINDTLMSPWNATNQIMMADTLLLPFTAIQALDTRVVANTSETLMTFIKRSNSYTQATGQPLRVVGLQQLETAGSGGTRRMIAYSRSARVVKFHMPMPFRFLDVWQDGPMSWLVPGIFRIGGTDWIRPASAVYADGF